MNVTFLTAEQIFDDTALNVLKEYGTGVGFSDLTVLQSGIMSGSNTNIEGKRTGSVWSPSPYKDGGVRCVGLRWLGLELSHVASRRRAPCFATIGDIYNQPERSEGSSARSAPNRNCRMGGVPSNNCLFCGGCRA